MEHASSRRARLLAVIGFAVVCSGLGLIGLPPTASRWNTAAIAVASFGFVNLVFAYFGLYTARGGTSSSGRC